MKQPSGSTLDMLHKIEAIEKDILSLKQSVLKELTSTNKKVVKLKGVLKGVKFTDEDFECAKKSLYSRMPM